MVLLTLLAMGDDLNWANADDNSRTALHKAAEKDRILAAEFLLQNNVSADAKDAEGHTALEVATAAKAERVMARLARKL